MVITSSTRKATHVDIHVGHRLKRLRRERDLSQTQVGQGVDVTFQQIQKYERGTNRISASRLWQFCEYFTVAPNYFYEGLTSQDLKSPDERRIA